MPYALWSLYAPRGDDSPTKDAALYDKLNFNFIRDMAPVAGIDRQPLVLEVTPSFPARNVPEFIAYAKAHPGQINFASAGIGNMTHLAAERFKMMTGSCSAVSLQLVSQWSLGSSSSALKSPSLHRQG